MPKIYLEYEEHESLDESIVYSLIDEDNDNSGTDNWKYDDSEDDEEKYFEEYIENEKDLLFLPIHLYRNPLPGCKEIDIDFDPIDCDILHLVVVVYSNKEEGSRGNWHISKVTKSRREAKEHALLVESDAVDGDLPWKQEDTEFESVYVTSLPVED